MSFRRYCTRCAKEVKCREERGGASSVALFCPDCEHRLGTYYGHIVIE